METYKIVHELEINQVAFELDEGKLSLTDAVLFLDYLEDETGTETSESVYSAIYNLMVQVQFSVLSGLSV